MRFFWARQEASPLRRAAQPRIFYGYVVVAVGFSIMLIIHGTFSVFGVFFNPLLLEFETSRAILSAASSLAFFLMGLMAILMGILADRWGPRVVITLGGLFFGVGHLLMSQAGAIWQIYLFYVVIGLGLSTSDVAPLATVVRWFIKKRGAMSGITKVGTGLGMMVMPLVANGLISTYGWRTSYIILGILVLVTVIPLAQLLRRDPHQAGQLPDGESQLDAEGMALLEEGLSLHEAIHSRQLWIVCGLYLTIFFSVQSVLIHIVPHAVDLGFSTTVAASVVATIGGASILGRLVMGFTGDRIGNKRAIVVCFLILVVALSWLQLASKLWMLYVFAAVYGFSHGGFFALISPVAAGLFGTRSQGTLLGVIIFSGTIGGSISPFLTGAVFDLTNSYRLAFFILLVFAIIGLTLTMFLSSIREGGKDDPRRSAGLG